MESRALTKRGLTLFELLVSVAILAFVAGLLAPVLAGARERAHEVDLRHRLRQGLAAQALYASDYDDRLAWARGPHALRILERDGRRYGRPHDTLLKQMPEFNDAVRPYGLALELDGRRAEQVTPEDRYDYNEVCALKLARLSEFADPSTAEVVRGPALEIRANGLQHAAFCGYVDGHVDRSQVGGCLGWMGAPDSDGLLCLGLRP